MLTMWRYRLAQGATCISLVRFDTPGNSGTYLAVGTAQGLTYNPRQADGAQTAAMHHECHCCMCIASGLHCKVLKIALGTD